MVGVFLVFCVCLCRLAFSKTPKTNKHETPPLYQRVLQVQVMNKNVGVAIAGAGAGATICQTSHSI
jgi:hypothetical protein